MQRIFDLFFNPIESEKEPLGIMSMGFLYVSLSLLLSIWIFPDHASLVMIFLSTISCLYIFERALVLEEKREKDTVSEKIILKEHVKVIKLFLYLFIGFLLAFMFWTIVLPKGYVDISFSIQQSTIQEIKSITGNATSNNPFSIILINNLRVLALSILLAVFYGAGAIFILAWNASIMGFVIGELARNTFGLSSLPIVFTKYFLHGIIEMVAYFIGALAGGILFIAILKRDIRKYRMKRLLIDSAILIGIAILLLIIGAGIETYISSQI